MQIRLPTTSIYGYIGQLSEQLSGQPTTFKYMYENSGHEADLYPLVLSRTSRHGISRYFIFFFDY